MSIETSQDNSGSTVQIKKIPYGMSNYGLIRESNYYYVDKTSYLETIEKSRNYLFFIRPRRFGKSLLLAMMETYFDVYYKDRFDEFFKGTWIYDHPTPKRGEYLVLFYNFASVDSNPDKVEVSFLNYIRSTSIAFMAKYRDYISKSSEINELTESLKRSSSASDILTNLLSICQLSNIKIYLMIDEYDNFANTILRYEGENAYHELICRAGFLGSFFNVIKTGTSSTDSPIERSFITGVSPVTMDDVTSGFNIGTSVTLDKDFSQAVGFNGNEVREMLNYYRSVGMIHHENDYLIEIFNRWYGNYLFSEHADLKDRMYNSDMILYFLMEYFKINAVPDDLIDRNVRTDYGKLKHLIILDQNNTKTTNGNFSKLKQIIENGGIPAKIVKGFPIEEITLTENFTSLMFYFGLLTIRGTYRDKLWLEIPNETVKRLFYDYIRSAYRDTGVFNLNLDKYSELMTGMAYDGDWKPLFELILSEMGKSMSLRDLITGEKSIQAFLNVYLGLTNLYIIHVERELNKGYSDLIMEPFLAHYEGIGYSYIVEIKYLSAGVAAGDRRVEELKVEAETQLKQYCMEEKLFKSLGHTKLIKLVLIFSGHEAVYIGEVTENPRDL